MCVFEPIREKNWAISGKAKKNWRKKIWAKFRNGIIPFLNIKNKIFKILDYIHLIFYKKFKNKILK